MHIIISSKSRSAEFVTHTLGDQKSWAQRKKPNNTITIYWLIDKEMYGEWEKAGIHSEDDIAALMREIRTEV